MKVKLKIEKEFEVKYLQVKAGARYWEDAIVDGVEDTEGSLIPCREGDYWCPLIELESGVIENWEHGKKASVHFKVCDDGEYSLLDLNKEVVKSIDGYVPDIMSPKESGYGDYIIMDIDENGKISNWRVKLDEFTDNED